MTDEVNRPRGWRRALRLVRRVVLFLFAFVVVGIGTALILIHTSWGRNYIRKSVEAELRTVFPGGARIAELEGSVLGDFTLRGIEIDGLDDKPAIKIEQLTANIALRKLFSKTAEFERLEIQGVVVRAGVPLTRPKPETTEPSEPTAWSVQLPEIELTRGTVEVEGGRALHIDAIDLTGNLAIPAGQPLIAGVVVRGTWRETKQPVTIDATAVVEDAPVISAATITVGGVKLTSKEITIDTVHPTGDIEIEATRAAVAAIDPAIELPGDAKLTIKASSAGQLVIDGTVGHARVSGSVRGDIAKRTATGYVAAGAASAGSAGVRSAAQRREEMVDIVSLLPPAIRSKLPEHLRGEVAVAATADRAGVRGILGVHGALLDLPASDATIVFDSNWRDATVRVLATGEGNAKVAVAAHGVRDGAKITLDRADVIATASDVTAATANRVRLQGNQLAADLWLKPGQVATLAPAISIPFTGKANGKGVRYDDVRVAIVDTAFTGTFDTKLEATAHVTLTGASRAGKPLGNAIVDAIYRRDDKIFAVVDARPAMAAVRVQARGTITPGPVTTIALGDHKITAPTGAPWIGKGGRIEIGDQVTVRDVVTTNGQGRARFDATIATGVFVADVDATKLPVSALDARYRGTVSGKLSVEKRGTRWTGGGDLTAEGVVVDPNNPLPFDGGVKVALANRTLTLDARATNPDIGTARIELDVEGPRDVTDLDAWRKLDRSALRIATITADKVSLERLAPTGGLIDGKLDIGPTQVEGSVEVKGVRTPVGDAEGTMTFSPQGGDLYASWHALLSEVGEGDVGVRIAFPQHPFDPAAWKQLGRGVVQQLTVRATDIAVDPGKLEKLGVVANYTGRADIDLDVAAGATSATLDVDLRSIEGGVLAKPVDIHIDASTDETETTASACVARTPGRGQADPCAKGGLAAATSTAVPLLEIPVARTPVTMATWISAPKTALTAPLSGKVKVPSQSAPDYLALFGRAGFVPDRGTFDGGFDIAGTIGNPTGTGALKVKNLQVASDIAGRSIPELTEMTVLASWDGMQGTIAVDAKERDDRPCKKARNNPCLGRFLTAKVIGHPARLAEATGTFTANQIELAPLAAFLPGELYASTGTLQAALTVSGFDLATSRILGDLNVTQGNLPIHPIVGTLRDATLRVVSSVDGIELKARGLLNACRDPNNPRCTENVWLEAKSPSDLSTLAGTLYAQKIAPIGEFEPEIDGTVKIDLKRTGREWTGDIVLRNCRRNDDKRCRNPKIVVPESEGDDLLDFEAPLDVYFIENAPKQLRFGEAKVPTKAWLDARVTIESTQIDVDLSDLQGDFTGSISTRSPIRLRVGDAVGLDGRIWLERGTATIYSRRYTFEQTDIVSFNDGTIEPTLDLEMSHDFPGAYTLTVMVQGKPSDPEFPVPDEHLFFLPKEKGDLFTVFLGGDPNTGAIDQTKVAALRAGTSIVARLLRDRVQRVLPSKLKLPELQCDPVSATTGASCTAGYRLLDDRLYLAGKHRLSPLPSENSDELQAQLYLSREWFLEGVFGESYGADILWRRRW